MYVKKQRYSMDYVADALGIGTGYLRTCLLAGMEFPFIHMVKGNKNYKYIINALEFEEYLRDHNREDLIIR